MLLGLWCFFFPLWRMNILKSSGNFPFKCFLRKGMKYFYGFFRLLFITFSHEWKIYSSNLSLFSINFILCLNFLTIRSLKGQWENLRSFPLKRIFFLKVYSRLIQWTLLSETQKFKWFQQKQLIIISKMGEICQRKLKLSKKCFVFAERNKNLIIFGKKKLSLN